MRHRELSTQLGRQSAHRRATLKSLCRAILLKGRITTTRNLARASRREVEQLITWGKKDSVHARRLAFSILNDRDMVKLLFKDIAPLFKSRNGGYTRIIPLPLPRRGDAAEMVILELTEQRVVPVKAKPVKKEKTAKPKSEETKPKAAVKVEEGKAEKPAIDVPHLEEAKPEPKKPPKPAETKPEARHLAEEKEKEAFKKAEAGKKKGGFIGGLRNLFKRQDKKQ